MQCEADHINFSHDGLQVLVGSKIYDIRMGGALGETRHVLESMYDHVHLLSDVFRTKWECSWCKRSILKNGEYWFTHSDSWLWIVEKCVPQRLIHIPVEYGIVREIKSCQGYVALRCFDKLLVLDTSRVR